MRNTYTQIDCDECSNAKYRFRAILRCEVHEKDLCESHMRSHYTVDCKLVPIIEDEGSLGRRIERHLK